MGLNPRYIKINVFYGSKQSCVLESIQFDALHNKHDITFLFFRLILRLHCAATQHVSSGGKVKNCSLFPQCVCLYPSFGSTCADYICIVVFNKVTVQRV